jgi:hypothetical protein
LTAGGDAPLIDVTKPSLARTYDYWLGGSNNFAADRELAAEIDRVFPGTRRMVLRNREFLKRAVTHAARSGISQFLDLGCGMPIRQPRTVCLDGGAFTVEAIHHTARQVIPDARVAYVDADRVVAAHSERVYGRIPGIAVIRADARDHAAVTGDSAFRPVIDPAVPVCVILG